MNKEIILPKLGKNEKISLEKNQSLIILGANGSGKSRLGAWIELQGPSVMNAHRISAQKSLTFPDSVEKSTSLENAENILLFGGENLNQGNKIHYKRGSKPTVHQLNDYQQLIDFLFSENNEEATRFREKSKLSATRIETKETRIDKIKSLRDKVLPHRELIIHGSSIGAKIKGSTTEYKASEMSDGERVIFYLIGKCLCVPQDSIIIIDEPEIHIHKALVYRLWSEIKKYKSDCIFVYLTHDIDFAVSMNQSKKVRLKSYENSQRDWEIYNDIAGIPEEIQLEIIGTRQKLLFVEGENGSFDTQIYSKLFPDIQVKCCGSCQNVITYVKALKDNSQFHGKEIYGLIDRDRRVDSEIQSLEEEGIYTLEIAEIENMFVVPELLAFLETHMSVPNAKDNAIENIISFLSEEKEHQITLRVAEEVKHQLKIGEFEKRNFSSLEESYEESYEELVKSIEIKQIYDEQLLLFSKLIDKKDYMGVLKFYNRKGLIERISVDFGITKEHIYNLIMNNIDQNIELRDDLIKYIPMKLTSLLH